MTRSGVKLPVGTAIWQCESNFVHCEHDHLLTLHRTAYRGDLRRLSGHVFLRCDECRPSSYFFAVFSTSPDPHVNCYAISEDSYKHWDKEPSATTLSTPEMLYQLRDPEGRSYNPHWRPAR